MVSEWEMAMSVCSFYTLIWNKHIGEQVAMKEFLADFEVFLFIMWNVKIVHEKYHNSSL